MQKIRSRIKLSHLYSVDRFVYTSELENLYKLVPNNEAYNLLSTIIHDSNKLATVDRHMRLSDFASVYSDYWSSERCLKLDPRKEIVVEGCLAMRFTPLWLLYSSNNMREMTVQDALDLLDTRNIHHVVHKAMYNLLAFNQYTKMRHEMCAYELVERVLLREDYECDLDVNTHLYAILLNNIWSITTENCDQTYSTTDYILFLEDRKADMQDTFLKIIDEIICICNLARESDLHISDFDILSLTILNTFPRICINDYCFMEEGLSKVGVLIESN